MNPKMSGAAQQKDSMAMPGGIRRRVRQLPRVPVITAPLEVDLTCAYEGLPHFTHFAGNIKFVGGINQPKLVQVHRALSLDTVMPGACMAAWRDFCILHHLQKD